MVRSLSLRLAAIFSVAFLVFSASAFAGDVPLSNWRVSARPGYSSLADVGQGAVFQAVTPCRLVDTRNAVGAFGGPSYSPSETRSYTIPAGPCSGIPIATAYSLNFTVFNFDGSGIAGYATAYPTGSARPTVSTVNFGSAGTTNAVANAAIVPANGAGSISVFISGATNLIIDINGYFPGSNVMNTQNFATVRGNYNGGSVFYVVNENTLGTSESTTSIRGQLSSTAPVNASGVLGEYFATGIGFGVKGVRSSVTTNAAGVLGYSGSRVTGSTGWTGQGVRGEALSGNGVVGVTNASGAVGVIGEYHNGTSSISSGLLGSGTNGVFANGNSGATGTKSFVEPHPTDASRVIRFVSLEGNEAGTYFRGKGRFIRGRAVINVPEEFGMVTESEGLTVHVTPIGRMAMVGVISADLSSIQVEGSRDVEFSYVVHGVRRGYGDFKAIDEGAEYRPSGPEATMPGHVTAAQRERLIANGTYNEDGSLNMNTAVRAGWVKAWEDQARHAAESAAKHTEQNPDSGKVLFDGRSPE